MNFYWLYIYFWLALFGACLGSFLNVVIYRLPKGTFFAQARSHCTECGSKLNALDLIPIVSWLLLKGHCRYCNARISERYMIIELACAFIAAGSFARFGIDLMTVLFFGIAVILLAISVIDLDTMEIPNPLVVSLIPFAIAMVFVQPDVTLIERAIGFFAISLPMLILALIITDAFGGGDIKLMAVCGFILGWKLVLLAFFIAIMTGGSYAIYLLLTGKSKRGAHIAFGPYLCFGIAVALIYGVEIINWYLKLPTAF